MNEGDEDVDEDIVNKVTISETGVIWVKPCINDKNINMQLDTGSSLTLMSYADFVKHFGNKQLCNVVMKTYSGEKLKSLGYALVKVRLNDKVCELKLHVGDVHAPSLMGRDWLGAICDREELLNVFNMRSFYDDFVVNRLLKDYNDVFDGSLGTSTKITGKLYLKKDAKPPFCKARSLPYAMKAKVEQELQRLQNNGIIEPVSWSYWATPIVPVLKKNESVHL